MKIVIELLNSSGCSLDSKVIELVEGETDDRQISRAVVEFVNAGVLDAGDTIKISEVL